jgi:hypothetical protein
MFLLLVVVVVVVMLCVLPLLQMYLTDVEEGGETVFPQVPPLPHQTRRNGWSACGMTVSAVQLAVPDDGSVGDAACHMCAPRSPAAASAQHKPSALAAASRLCHGACTWPLLVRRGWACGRAKGMRCCFGA